MLTVAYRRSGGIAGVDLVAEVRVDELDHESGAAARQLFDDPPRSPRHRARGADRFGFEINISDGTTTRTFVWSEPDVPEAARRLVAELTRRAEPSR